MNIYFSTLNAHNLQLGQSVSTQTEVLLIFFNFEHFFCLEKEMHK